MHVVYIQGLLNAIRVLSKIPQQEQAFPVWTRDRKAF